MIALLLSAHAVVMVMVMMVMVVIMIVDMLALVFYNFIVRVAMLIATGGGVVVLMLMVVPLKDQHEKRVGKVNGASGDFVKGPSACS